jgi:hypothetical protein
MLLSNRVVALSSFLAVLFSLGRSAYAADISGPIASTLTIMDNSRLVNDVTCTVTGAPCIAFGASGLTLDLNGFSITGQADPKTGCGGTSIANEVGIDVNAQSNAVIVGPGVVQRFRNMGIRLVDSTATKVTGVTTSTNCSSGIIVQRGSLNDVEGNTAIQNGNLGAPCGGI